MTLWFGWYVFNCESSLLLSENVDSAKVATRVAVNTTLSVACGALSAVFTEAFFTGRIGKGSYSLPMAMNGALTGLDAITAGCGTVEMWSATLICILCGWLYMFASWLLVKLRIDDAVEAVPVHLFGGLVRTTCYRCILIFAGHAREAFGTDKHVGFSYAIGRYYDSTNFILLRNQIYALLFILGWSTCCMLPFFLILNWLGLFRANKHDEIAGLDVVYHQGELTPDVKQELLEAKTGLRNARQQQLQLQNLHGHHAGSPPGFGGNVVSFAMGS